MQKANCDRSRAGASDGGDGIAKRLIVKRCHDLAVGLEALLHSKTQLARHKRLPRRRAQIVAVPFETFAHFDDIPMALGGEQRDLRALPLQQGIGRDRRSVHNPVRHAEHFRARQL